MVPWEDTAITDGKGFVVSPISLEEALSVVRNGYTESRTDSRSSPSQLCREQTTVAIEVFLANCNADQLEQMKQQTRSDLDRQTAYYSDIRRQMEEGTMEAQVANQKLQNDDLNTWLTGIRLKSRRLDDQWAELEKLFSATPPKVITKRRLWSQPDPQQMIASDPDVTVDESTNEEDDFFRLQDDVPDLPKWGQKRLLMNDRCKPEVNSDESSNVLAPATSIPMHPSVQDTSMDSHATAGIGSESRPTMNEDELVQRMRAVTAIVEEADPESMDRICPGWTGVIVALGDWLEAEGRHSGMACLLRERLTRIEAAIIENLQDAEDICGQLRYAVERSEISAREAMQVLLRQRSPDMYKAVNLAAAFEQAGASAIASGLRRKTQELIDVLEWMLEVDERAPAITPVMEHCPTPVVSFEVPVVERKETTGQITASTDVIVGQVSVHVAPPDSIAVRLSPPEIVDTTRCIDVQPLVDVDSVDVERHTRMVKSLMKGLGTFDGDEDLDIFLMKFDSIAEVAGWTDDDRLGQLMALLCGKAAQVLLCQKYYSGDALVDKLRQWFVVPMDPDAARTELRQMRQDVEETLPELAARIEHWATLAAPQLSPAEREKLLSLPAFLDAMTDSETSYELKKMKVNGIADALKEASFLQDLKKWRRKRSGSESGDLSGGSDVDYHESSSVASDDWRRLSATVVDDVPSEKSSTDTQSSDSESVSSGGSTGSHRRSRRRRNRPRRNASGMTFWNSDYMHRRQDRGARPGNGRPDSQQSVRRGSDSEELSDGCWSRGSSPSFRPRH